MTICVYYKDVLAADGMSSYGGGDVKNTNVKKIGMVYESLTTGARSLDPNALEYPVEFAMYAISGSINHIPRFLRWLVSTDHPGIDYEYDTELESEDTDYNLEDSAIHTMVIFKNFPFVREYFSNYPSLDYTETTKNNMSSIGSGTFTANAINKYDPEASAIELIQAVSNVSTTCGGDIYHLSFHDEQELIAGYGAEIQSTLSKDISVLTKIKRFFKRK